MYIFIFIFLFLLAILLGKYTHLEKIRDLENKLNFLSDYRNKFVDMANEFINNDNLNKELYYELIENSNKAQRLLGETGSVTYKAPFSNLIHYNYKIVLNTIPQFKTGNIDHFEITSADDSLVRQCGILKEILQSLVSENNINMWFQIGSREILYFPLRLLSFTGILSFSKLENITTSNMFKVINGIVWLLALLGTVITIFTGWEPLIKILDSLF